MKGIKVFDWSQECFRYILLEQYQGINIMWDFVCNAEYINGEWRDKTN